MQKQGRMKTNKRTFPLMAILVIVGLVIITVIIFTTNKNLNLSGSVVGTEQVVDALPQPTATDTPPIPPIPPTDETIIICHSLNGLIYDQMVITVYDLPFHNGHPYDIIPMPPQGCPTAPPTVSLITPSPTVVPSATPTPSPSPTPAPAVITISFTCLPATGGNPQRSRFIITNKGGTMTSAGSYTLTRDGTTVQTGTFTLASGQTKVVGATAPDNGHTFVLTVSNVPNGPMTVTKNC
jgi:hypothetical protein